MAWHDNTDECSEKFFGELFHRCPLMITYALRSYYHFRESFKLQPLAVYKMIEQDVLYFDKNMCSSARLLQPNAQGELVMNG